MLIRPYDDPLIVAGQGTVGLELAEQAARRDAMLDAVLVCCGGGGLVAGCAMALTGKLARRRRLCGRARRLRRHGALARGRASASPTRRALARSATRLLAPMPGELTFAINSRLLAGGLAVTDAEVATAMRLAFRHLRLVVEPGGAVALAAALAGRLPTRGRTIGVVVSGGNVDAELFAQVLAAPN